MSAITPDFYDEDYFENGIRSEKSGYTGYEFNSSYTETAKGLMKEFNPLFVLDVGCAKGFLIREFASLGVFAWGVEISEYACSQAPDSVKKVITNCSIVDFEMPLNVDHFDLAIFYDILEHLTDEQLEAVMFKLRDEFKPTYVTMKCPFEVFDWDIDKSHINIKPESEWIALFNRFGFEVYVPTIPKAPWTWWDNRTLCFKIKV